MTHRVQKVDNPYRIITTDAFYPFPILLPMKDVADLIVKLGTRVVEAKELFQGIKVERGHGGRSLGNCRRHSVEVLALEPTNTICGKSIHVVTTLRLLA